MKIKLIAIGSRIMGDDGAAIAVAEMLQQELTEQGIQVIIGETDSEYCYSSIEDGECLLLLDAAISGKKVGSVWQQPLGDAIGCLEAGSYQHDADLLCLLKIRNIQPQGLLICIEIETIRQSFKLSDELQMLLPAICLDIKEIIWRYRGELQNA